jgi:hypothetical protein
MVIAYKFLDDSGCSVFTGQPWSLPGEVGAGPWIEADSVRPCHSGIHACRVDDLAYWLHTDLWEIELEGDITVAEHKVVARRGRIVRRVEPWSTVWPELAAVAAWRTRDLAVAALTDQNEGDLAERFGNAADLDQLAALGEEAGELGDQTPLGRAMALAADGGHFAANGEPAQAPFVAAVASGHAAIRETDNDSTFDPAFAAERRYQSAWIKQRLDLD